MAASFPRGLAGLLMKHCAGGDVDLVPVIEGQALNVSTLIDNAVDAVGILDDPSVVLTLLVANK